jgi:hypothetical protein
MAVQLRLGLLPYRWPWPDFYHRPCSASAPDNLGREREEKSYMSEPTHYFEVGFERQGRTGPEEFQKKSSRRTIVVEVCAWEDLEGGRFTEEDAVEIARTTACELARRELDHSVNGEGVLTQLGDFPPVLRDVQPDIDEPEVRAWLLKS